MGKRQETQRQETQRHELAFIYGKALAAIALIKQAPNLPEVDELGQIERRMLAAEKEEPELLAMRVAILRKLSTRPEWILWRLRGHLGAMQMGRDLGLTDADLERWEEIDWGKDG